MLNSTLPINLTGLFVVPPFSTPNETVTGSITSQVSGQSALWALIALGLNAMTFPSADHLTDTSLVLSAVRSSPLTCLADAVIVLVWIIYMLYLGQNVTFAARMVRRYFRGDEEDKPMGTRSLAGLILFILGPLPQAVKLVGMSGIPWTQSWGVCYFTSFLLLMAVDAAVLKHPHSDHSTYSIEYGRLDSIAGPLVQDPFHHIVGNLRPYCNTLHVLSHVLQFGMWTWTSFVLLITLFKSNSSSGSEAVRAAAVIVASKIALMVTCGFAIYYVTYQARHIIHRLFGFWISRVIFWGIWLGLTFWLAPLSRAGPTLIILNAKLDGIWHRQTILDVTTVTLRESDAWTLMIMVFGLCLLLVTLLDNSYHGLAKILSRKSRTTDSHEAKRAAQDEHQGMWSKRRLSYALSLFNLTYGTMYYILVFDGKGSRSPNWTKILG